MTREPPQSRPPKGAKPAPQPAQEPPARAPGRAGTVRYLDLWERHLSLLATRGLPARDRR